MVNGLLAWRDLVDCRRRKNCTVNAQAGRITTGWPDYHKSQRCNWSNKGRNIDANCTVRKNAVATDAEESMTFGY